MLLAVVSANSVLPSAGLLVLLLSDRALLREWGQCAFAGEDPWGPGDIERAVKAAGVLGSFS